MPKSIKIGNLRYDVNLELIQHKAQEADIGHKCSATSSQVDELMTLRVGDVSSLNFRKQAILHECLHQIFRSISGYDPDGDQQEDGRKEERICGALEAGLLMLLRENPELVEWLRVDE